MAKKTAKKAGKVKKIKPSTSDAHLGEEIKIKCVGADVVDISILSDFQGSLKTLSDAAYDRLKASILSLGFSFPVAAWKYRNKTFIIDAHQRIATLRKMQQEGYVVPKIPVVWIEAESEAEAAKKILAATSQYGEVTPDGLHGFMEKFHLTMADIQSSFQFPEIDQESFRLTFYPEKEIVQFEANREWKGMPEFNQEDKTAFRSIIVHFHDQVGVDKFAELVKQKITDKTRMLWYPEIIIEKAADKRYGNHKK